MEQQLVRERPGIKNTHVTALMTEEWEILCHFMEQVMEEQLREVTVISINQTHTKTRLKNSSCCGKCPSNGYTETFTSMSTTTWQVMWLALNQQGRHVCIGARKMWVAIFMMISANTPRVRSILVSRHTLNMGVSSQSGFEVELGFSFQPRGIRCHRVPTPPPNTPILSHLLLSLYLFVWFPFFRT